MNSEVRVAFIGAGTVAEMHGRGVAALPNVRLAARSLTPQPLQPQIAPESSSFPWLTYLRDLPAWPP